MTVLLDASAVLAAFRREPGAEAVEAALGDAALSVVTIAEIVAKLTDWNMQYEAAIDYVEGLGCTPIDFDHGMARLSAALRPLTRAARLSLGDRACIATALTHDLPVLTGDRIWAELKLDVDIRLMR